MKRFPTLVLGLILLTSCPGCTVSDVVFAMFQDHYGNEHETNFEKRQRFDEEMEKWEGYEQSP